MTLDEKRGIVYIPLGIAALRFLRRESHRPESFRQFLVALDARTGKRLWHFQFVHHDLWDYDLARAPKLLTVRHNGQDGGRRRAAHQTGFLFVFDRVTGQPLWPIEERAVPKSDVPGEESWPTQPFPTKPRSVRAAEVHRG